MSHWVDETVDARVCEVLEATEPLRSQIEQHDLNKQLISVEALQTFMEHHVYAVWDFMSLVTSLRNHFSGVAVPWVPVGSAQTRRFINEIMLGEESDHVSSGYISHYEMYLQAMEQVGADTSRITALVWSAQNRVISGDVSMESVLSEADIPVAARDFLQSTWRVVAADDPAELVGAFAFGRESLIPPMFQSLLIPEIRQLRATHFVDYIERHIELDGDEHSGLAFDLAVEVCGDDPSAWGRLQHAARDALQARIDLWDGVSQLV